MQKERNEARRTKANQSKETRKDRKRICEIPKKEMKRTVKSKYFPHNTILVFDTSCCEAERSERSSFLMLDKLSNLRPEGRTTFFAAKPSVASGGASKSK